MSSALPTEGAELSEYRPLLLSIAYRMLGSVADAEDIVQEASLRFHNARKEGIVIESPKAYLAAITTRLSIDYLRSARVRRESYVGMWLPEPLVAGKEPRAMGQAEMGESLSMAFLLILESLSPVERAVFLLREVFDYSYKEIAAVVEKSEENCRQMFARARQHIDAGKPRFEVQPEKREELGRQFLAACRTGDLAGLTDLLATDAAFYGDGGGKVPGAVLRPIHGRDRVARLVHSVFYQKGRDYGLHLQPATVNGSPGILVLDTQDKLISVMHLDVGSGGIQAVRVVVNPDKLAHLGPISELTAGKDKSAT